MSLFFSTPAPPDLLLDQRTARAAVHADLALLAELVDAVVHGIIVCHGRIGGDEHEPGPRAEVGRQQLAIGPELPKSGGDEHRYVGSAVVVWAVDLRVIAPLSNVCRELEAPSLPQSRKFRSARYSASRLGMV